ncbi:MAG: hypothetical protein WCF94_01585, partial [bacterium]
TRTSLRSMTDGDRWGWRDLENSRQVKHVSLLGAFEEVTFRCLHKDLEALIDTELHFCGQSHQGLALLATDFDRFGWGTVCHDELLGFVRY